MTELDRVVRSAMTHWCFQAGTKFYHFEDKRSQIDNKRPRTCRVCNWFATMDEKMVFYESKYINKRLYTIYVHNICPLSIPKGNPVSIITREIQNGLQWLVIFHVIKSAFLKVVGYY